MYQMSCIKYHESSFCFLPLQGQNSPIFLDAKFINLLFELFIFHFMTLFYEHKIHKLLKKHLFSPKVYVLFNHGRHLIGRHEHKHKARTKMEQTAAEVAKTNMTLNQASKLQNTVGRRAINSLIKSTRAFRSALDGDNDYVIRAYNERYTRDFKKVMVICRLDNMEVQELINNSRFIKSLVKKG